MDGGLHGGLVPPTRHRQRLDRSLRWVHALVLVSFAVVTWTLAPADLFHVGLAIGELALGASIVVTGPRVYQVGWAAVLMVVSATPPFQESGDISGGFALGAVLLSAMRVLPRVAYAVVGVAAIGLAAGAQQVLGASGDQFDSLSVYLLAVTNTYVAGRLVESLERSTDDLDNAEAEASSVSLRAVAEWERERALSAAVQVLHDDVLNALRAVEGRSEPRPEVARRACASAVAAVEAIAGETKAGPLRHGVAREGLDALLEAVSEDAPIPFDVTYDVEGPILEFSQSRLDATGRAVREALRNVERHTAVDRAAVRITSRPGRVTISVIDEGPGFSKTTTPGVGIRESIRRTVEQVGGTTQLSSTPSGTTVTVTFEDSGSEVKPTLCSRTYQLTTSSGGERRLVTETMTPLALVWLPISAWDAMRAADPVPELLLIIAIACMPVAVVARLAFRPPTTRWLVTFGMALSALQVAGLALTPHGGLLDLRSWSVGFLATPVIVVGFLVPLRWSLGLIVAQVAIVLGSVALRPGLSSGEVPVSALNALLAAPLLTVSLGVALRRNGRAVESERRRILSVSAERARLRSLRTVNSLHLDHTRRAVVPWLRDVAEGRLELGSEAVRRESRRLAQETRDDLYVPGFYSPGLRCKVSEFRDRGGLVEISPGFAPGAHARTSGRLLGDLVGRLPPAHRIRLSPPSDTACLVRLVIAPTPDPVLVDKLRQRKDVHVSGDELALVLEFEEIQG